jgi:hypothetical protein
MAQDLTKLFNKFAGKEVPMTEQCVRTKTGGYTQVDLADKNDPTLQAMEKLAKDNGLKLRLLWPSMAGMMDFNPNRITAYIGKEADGKYRVSGEFIIG